MSRNLGAQLRRNFRRPLLAIAAVVVASEALNGALAADAVVDFNRDVRPILSDACFTCHGPDEDRREGDLRLDTAEGLAREVDGKRVVAAGKPDASELLKRVLSTDPDVRMPPPKSGKPLSEQQVSIIRRWIEQGARWQQHWAFVAPTRPALPAVRQMANVRNPIDAFVIAKLEQQKLAPSAEADPRTLLRRVTFDLTGLPPTLDEQQAFLAECEMSGTNGSAEQRQQCVDRAYERLVDRLLASPRYAERMAIRWIDGSRYADTNGYQSDGPRDMWRWRDWVLEAFADNMPFDQFTIEQLAGDLISPEYVASDTGTKKLPTYETLRRLTASGFNRNHRGNSEGGIVPEEYQVEYVVDRVDTTFTVWLGLTMGCARCHSHKYDPILQSEYYGVFSFFNNLPEYGRAIKEGNSPPFEIAPTREQFVKLERLLVEQHQRRKNWQDGWSNVLTRMTEWERELVASQKVEQLPEFTIQDGLIAHFNLDGDIQNAAKATAKTPIVSQTTVMNLNAPKASKLPPGWDGATTASQYTNGKLSRAAAFDGQHYIRIGDAAAIGYFDKFSFGAWIHPTDKQSGTIFSKMESEEQGAGYSLDLTRNGTLQVNFVKRWLDDALRVETKAPIPVGEWVHVFVTYDSSRVASGIKIFINGREVEHRSNLDAINQTFAVDEPFRIGAGQANFKGLIDDVRVYDRHLAADEVAVLAVSTPLRDLVVKPAADRTSTETAKLRRFYLEVTGPESLRAQFKSNAAFDVELQHFIESLPTVMVMSDAQPKDSHVLVRGAYDRPGQKVAAGVPSCFPPLPTGASRNRLTFAKWLVSSDHPLTARVTVNRFWQNFFGTGLVKTTEDFGAQGERPSHPDLLDWLAREFADNGWDVKRLLKLIVLSHTYRQSSGVSSSDAASADPENRWLARGPRFRLSAEMVRDQALAVSGLMTEHIGGTSVYPYQPEGLWQELATVTEYPQSHGSDLYRRSLYTYWKRTVPPPMMMTFDTAGRETCEVRQTRTNTPLQSLNLLNDVTFLEAARVLAQRLLREEQSDDARLRRAFELVVCRAPTALESKVLLSSVARYRRAFAAKPAEAQRLIRVGESPAFETARPEELAAWATVCSTLLNLDEAVTKE